MYLVKYHFVGICAIGAFSPQYSLHLEDPYLLNQLNTVSKNEYHTLVDNGVSLRGQILP